MKKLFAPALAAALLLAACNTDEAAPKEEEKAPATEQTKQTDNTPVETPEAPETTMDTATDTATETTEAPAESTTEQPAEKDTVTEAKIYVSDANAENVELGETIQHSLKKDGPLTKFIIDKLQLTEYYNTHTVSADEKTIMIDFKESLLYSNAVQGSAGGWMFAGQIYASFFETIPTLQNIELRVDGEEVELDHISFTGAVKRADYEAAYKK